MNRGLPSGLRCLLAQAKKKKEQGATKEQAGAGAGSNSDTMAAMFAAAAGKKGQVRLAPPMLDTISQFF